MKTCFVIGAGASRSAAANAGVSELEDQKRLPPLDADFFKILSEREPPIFGRFEQFFRRNLGLQLEGQNISAEEVFNLLFAMATTEPPLSADAQDSLHSLVTAFARTIALTTQSVDPLALEPLKCLFNACLGLDTPDLSVITFNYDLMIEEALHDLGRGNNGAPYFDAKYSYGIQLIQWKRSSSSEMFPFGSSSDQLSVPVLKLHGSLNWLFVNSDKDNFMKPTPPLSTDIMDLWQSRKLPDFLSDPEESTFFDEGTWTYYKPMIAPPVFAKDAFFSKILSPIWKRASSELASAERIIVFGYSFPSTDVRSKLLFLSSLRQRSRLKEFIVIDKNPFLCGQIGTMFQLNTFRYFRNPFEAVDVLSGSSTR